RRRFLVHQAARTGLRYRFLQEAAKQRNAATARGARAPTACLLLCARWSSSTPATPRLACSADVAAYCRRRVLGRRRGVQLGRVLPPRTARPRARPPPPRTARRHERPLGGGGQDRHLPALGALPGAADGHQDRRQPPGPTRRAARGPAARSGGGGAAQDAASFAVPRPLPARRRRRPCRRAGGATARTPARWRYFCNFCKLARVFFCNLLRYFCVLDIY
ncbi:hypothetical protein EJB05_37250, partial [Eragrostis curvula]